MKMSDVCKVGTGMADADFWIKRIGSSDTVGKPHKNLDMDDIGIKVIRTDILFPDYLYYVMMMFQMQGVFDSLAVGKITKILTIKSVSDIKIQDQ
jgi:hypothetical protein